MKNYLTSKHNLIAASLIAAAVFASVFTSCKGKEEAKEEVKVQYECPMHPEQVSDKPGTCPVCKMDLVEKKAEKKEEHQH
jgi:Cu(I)/Ag(I) efflux system membrane fusion protein